MLHYVSEGKNPDLNYFIHGFASTNNPIEPDNTIQITSHQKQLNMLETVKLIAESFIPYITKIFCAKQFKRFCKPNAEVKRIGDELSADRFDKVFYYGMTTLYTINLCKYLYRAFKLFYGSFNIRLSSLFLEKKVALKQSLNKINACMSRQQKRNYFD